MSFILFDTAAQQTLGRERPDRYTVDGQPGALPAHLVELKIVEQPFPQNLAANERVADRNETVDLVAKTLTRGWRVETFTPIARQDTDVVLQRLTEAERTALFTARTQSPGIDYFVTRATAAGAIRDDDPEFPTARDALDQLGIIAAGRWTALLAP